MDLEDTFYSEEETVVLSSSERFWATDGRLTSSTRDRRSRMRSVSRSYRDNVFLHGIGFDVPHRRIQSTRLKINKPSTCMSLAENQYNIAVCDIRKSTVECCF
jgi:hypothetical protein